jgi:MFS transporter, ACS family, tartrate transporter
LSDIAIRRRTMSKVTRRLIPLMIAMFCVNFLDRVNIGFAALQMNRDLGLTPEAYGFAAGILFISYTVFEIPSNLILYHVGPRIWLARILVTWGIIAALNALVYDSLSLYVMRFILGAAEAGFFPGLMIYVIAWFPARERAKAVTWLMAGSPIAVIFGAPLSALILSLDKVWHVAGWQWLFVLEGLPAVVLGILCYTYLTDRPEGAPWLEPEERAWLARTIADESRTTQLHSPARVGALFLRGTVWLLALSKFCVILAFFGVALWLPQIVKSLGTLSTIEIGLITALPNICAAIGSVLVGRSSDRSGERTLHIAVPAFVGALGFMVAWWTANPYVAMVAICVASTGIWVSNTVFWTLPTALLAGAPAAAGLAFINSVGNMGGFFGPYFTGWIRGSTGSFALALAMLGGWLALSGLIVLIIGRRVPHPSPEHAIRAVAGDA